MTLRTWLYWRERCPCCSHFGVEEMAAEQVPAPGAGGACGTKKWRRRGVWETGLGTLCTFKASFQGLSRDQLPLGVMLLKNTALTCAAAFSFPVSLSLVAVAHPLIWAGISGSCGPVSDQQYFLKCSAVSNQGGQPDAAL